MRWITLFTFLNTIKFDFLSGEFEYYSKVYRVKKFEMNTFSKIFLRRKIDSRHFNSIERKNKDFLTTGN